MQVNTCFLRGPLRWLTEQKNPKFTKRTAQYNEFRNFLVRAMAEHLWQVITWRDLTVLSSLEKFNITLHLNCFKSFCLRDRGRLGNRGRPIWLKFGTLSYYGDLCNMPKFQLHCSYLGWVLDGTLLGVTQCFFIAHFGHFSILWLQFQGYFKPNINSLFIISILKGFIAKHMDQRNISVVCEIIVKLMLLKTFLVKLKIARI